MSSVSMKLSKAAQPFLKVGEVVQASFYAMSQGNGYNDRAVVATNVRIMLFSLTFTGRIEEHLSDVYRDTRIGPAKGFLRYTTSALGPSLNISSRFYTDVEEADSWLSTDAKVDYYETTLEEIVANSDSVPEVNQTSRRRRWRETVLDFLSYGADSELGIAAIAIAFVLISPFTIAKLSILAFRTSDGTTSKYLRRRIVLGLLINLGFWVLAAVVVVILIELIGLKG